ncbi:MAG: HXXEE domain-containing protein [Gemmatimonadaceae bacterium]
MLTTGCSLSSSGLFAWGLLAVMCAHEYEEFVWPGGFRTWYIAYSPHVEQSMTRRFLLFINTIVPATAAMSALFFAAPWARMLWLAVASGVGINAVWHILATVRGSRYSPGVVTAATLCLPFVAYSFARIVSCGLVSPRNVLTAATYGAVYWILSEGRKLFDRAPRPSHAPHLSVLR